MKSLVGNSKNFEFNSKINRKPMEIQLGRRIARQKTT